MSSRRAAALLVAASLLGACNRSDEPAEQARSTTARPSSADRAELRAELEWLLSPTRPCQPPPPPRLDARATAEPVESMLQLLGLEPTPTPHCPEGDQQP